MSKNSLHVCYHNAKLGESVWELLLEGYCFFLRELKYIEGISMTKWYVELYVGQDILHTGEPFIREDDQTVLSFLSTCLQDPLFTVVIDDNYHFLISSDLDAFNNEDEVYQYAKTQLLPILNGIMQIKVNNNICRIKIGDVYHLNNNGYLERTAMRATWVVKGLFPLESVLKASNSQQPSITEILLMARNNHLVAEALQHFATSQSWYSLVKIFEIIAEYAGHAENSGKLPKGTFNKWTQGIDFGNNPPGKSFDFLQTAHSYHWSGLSARHSSIRSQKRTGVTPITLNDAIEYITDVFLKWLQSNP